MLNRIRLATNEEVDAHREGSDFDVNCVMLALDTQAGTAFAVVRKTIEVDPAIYPEGFSVKLKAMFTRDIETVLAAQGTPNYYFNVKADDEAWQHVVETWGAERVSNTPEIRYKRTL